MDVYLFIPGIMTFVAMFVEVLGLWSIIFQGTTDYHRI